MTVHGEKKALKSRYNARQLLTTYDDSGDFWITCGLVNVLNSGNVRFCGGLTALEIPIPCSNPERDASGMWQCPVGDVEVVSFAVRNSESEVGAVGERSVANDATAVGGRLSVPHSTRDIIEITDTFEIIYLAAELPITVYPVWTQVLAHACNFNVNWRPPCYAACCFAPLSSSYFCQGAGLCY